MEGRGIWGEQIHVYIWLNLFTVHLKLLQHCQLAVPQYKIKSLLKKKKKAMLTALSFSCYADTTVGLTFGQNGTEHRLSHGGLLVQVRNIFLKVNRLCILRRIVEVTLACGTVKSGHMCDR